MTCRTYPACACCGSVEHNTPVCWRERYGLQVAAPVPSKNAAESRVATLEAALERLTKKLQARIEELTGLIKVLLDPVGYMVRQHELKMTEEEIAAYTKAYNLVHGGKDNG